jgi:hypothetical protein
MPWKKIQFVTPWFEKKLKITTKPFKDLINKEDKKLFYYVWHGIIYEIQTLTFFFSKFIQMLQMKTWFWSLFNNVFKKNSNINVECF